MTLQNNDFRKYVSELLGTFVLTLVVSLALAGPSGVITPVLAAFVVALFVYTVGHVSGAHFNPAVTIGAWTIGKIKPQDAVAYVIAQFVGAAVASLIIFKVLGFNLPSSPLVSGWQDASVVVLAEAIGMFLFAFGIASVVYGKVSEAAKGWVIGMSLLIGILLASGFGSSGIINPAVAFGINSFSWMYVVGPVVGAVAGMWVYKTLASHG